jgi:putative DNA methylase
LTKSDTDGDLNPIPDESLPPVGTLGFRVQRYGIDQWSGLFNVRQLLSLKTLCDLIQSFVDDFSTLQLLLAFAFSRVAMSNMSCTRWNAVAEKMQHTFGRQALPIVWDFAEVVPIAQAPGNWQSGYELAADVVEMWPSGTEIGQMQLADATESPLVAESSSVWFTDPPYYDAVPYSDLSDFFFVWLKRTLRGYRQLQDPFDPRNPLTPKTREAVQDEAKMVNGKPKNRAFFEETMAKAFAEGRRSLREDGIGSVVFAHKTTEGWEALLTGMIGGGWTITGSWPVATEMKTRLRAMDSAALATSIHLICRPRELDAPTGDWGDVIRTLPRHVSSWMTRLESEGIRGADLVFACIGPALEIYSQYSQVVDAEDRPIPLGGDPTATEPYKRGYLAYVWETVARLALEQILGSSNGGSSVADALEEDARLTALFLWTQQATDSDTGLSLDDAADEESDDPGEEDEDDSAPRSGRKGGLSLPFDVVRRFAQPLGIHLPAWEDRIISTQKGVVRLMAIGDRAHQLFGIEGAEAVAVELERGVRNARDMQLSLFAQSDLPTPKPKGGRRKVNVADADLQARQDATTLDRVHAAMLLQKSGRTNALRALLAAEQEQGATFLRLANALSGLYPRESEEKRLVDAMLLAYPK